MEDADVDPNAATLTSLQVVVRNDTQKEAVLDQGTRDLIEGLYINEGLSLAQVRQRLSSELQIQARLLGPVDCRDQLLTSISKSQIRTCLNKRGIKKNTKASEWKYIYRKVENRKKHGKNRSSVYINGTLISASKLRKDISRHVPLSLQYQLLDGPSPSPLEHITICTPGPLVASYRTPISLPFLNFMNSMDTILSQNKSRFTKDLQMSWADLKFFKPFKRSDLSEKWHGLTDLLLTEGESQRSVPDAEIEPHETGKYSPLQSFKQILFELSNNMLSDSDLIYSINWLVENHYQSSILDLISAEGPTSRVIAEQLVGAAIEQGYEEFAKQILEHYPGCQLIDKAMDCAAKQMCLRRYISVLTPLEKLLLRNRSDFFQHICRTAIHEQRDSSIDVINWILVHEPNVLESFCPQDLSSILLQACSHSDGIRLIAPLLKAGANVNVIGVSPQWDEYAEAGKAAMVVTPLLLLIWRYEQSAWPYERHRIISTVALLLAEGALVNGPTMYDISRVTNTGHENSSVSQILCWTPLILAIRTRSHAITQLLHEAGADVNLSLNPQIDPEIQVIPINLDKHLTDGFCTPLEVAIGFGDIACFCQLLEWGARVSPDRLEHMVLLCHNALNPLYLEALTAFSDEDSCYLRAVIDGIKSQKMTDYAIARVAFSRDRDHVNLQHVSTNRSLNFQCQLAVAALCRKADAHKGLKLDQVHRILCCLDQNIDFSGREIDTNAWVDIQYSLLRGDFGRVFASLNSSERDIIVRRSSESPDKIANLQGIDTLLRTGGDVHDSFCFTYQGKEHHSTPLHTAIMCGDLHLLQYLLARGADPNAWCRHRGATSPLQQAVIQGSLSMADSLIAAGGNLSGQTLHEHFWSGCTDYCSGKASLNAVRVLVKVGADVNAPYKVCFPAKCIRGCRCCHNTSELLDINATRDAQYVCYTLLHWYAHCGNSIAVQFLVENGADLNICWKNGDIELCSTAIQKAAISGRKKIVDILLQNGANVNIEAHPRMGRTALQGAAQNNHTGIVERLLEAGAEVNAPPAQYGGVTALQAAAIGGNLLLVKLLIERGADVAAPGATEQGRTALQGAAEHGRLDTLQLLLNHYNSPDWREACVSAAEFAEKEKRYAIAKFLRDYANN